MFGNILSKIGNFARKAIGSTSGIVKTLGDFTGRAGKIIGATDNFVKQYHQPIALMSHAIGEASGNPTLKGIGNMALMGSAAASALNIGKDYIGSGGPAARVS